MLPTARMYVLGSLRASMTAFFSGTLIASNACGQAVPWKLAIVSGRIREASGSTEMKRAREDSPGVGTYPRNSHQVEMRSARRVRFLESNHVGYRFSMTFAQMLTCHSPAAGCAGGGGCSRSGPWTSLGNAPCSIKHPKVNPVMLLASLLISRCKFKNAFYAKRDEKISMCQQLLMLQGKGSETFVHVISTRLPVFVQRVPS